MDPVENEPHAEGCTQHLAERLAVPGASAAAEVKMLMDSGSSITAMSEVAGTGPAGTAGDDANHVNAGICRACVCGDVVGSGVRY